jgi:hypothetical protein
VKVTPSSRVILISSPGSLQSGRGMNLLPVASSFNTLTLRWPAQPGLEASIRTV